MCPRIRSLSSSVLVPFILFAPLLAAADPPKAPPAAPAPPAQSSPLAAMQWMIGDWHATAKAPDGSVTQIDNRISWAENRTAIFFVTRFNGVPHYSGMYAWDPERKLVAFWYTDDAGALTQGTARLDGKRWVQDFAGAKPDGTKNPPLRSYIELATDGSRYHWFVVRPADESKPLIALDYVRAK